MDTSVSPKDEIWFLRVCHHISKAVYLTVGFDFLLEYKPLFRPVVGLRNGALCIYE